MAAAYRLISRVSRLRRLITVGLFLASYGGARGLAFMGILLLPRLLSAEVYGGVELALSIAGLLGNAVGLGVPQATARLRLLLGHERVTDLLALAFLLSATPLVLGSIAAAVVTPLWIVPLTLVFAAIYGAQYNLSFWARAEGQKFMSTWVDNGTLVLIGIGAGILTVLHITPEMPASLYALWAVAALFVAGGGITLYRFRIPGLWLNWRKAMHEGLPLLATGLVLAAFVAAPRLLAGRFLSLADVGALALAARICLLLLIFYQLLMTWNFRNFYIWPAERCDKVFAAILIGLASLGSLVMLVWPWAAPVIAPEFPELPRLTVGLVAGQTVLWVALALFENSLGRQGLGIKAAPTLFLVGLAAWGIIEVIMLFVPITSHRIALAGIGLMAAGVTVQWGLLYRSGLSLPRSGLALVSAALPALLALLFGV